MSNIEINDWDGVDAAVRRMGEIDIAVERINGKAQEEINDVKERAKERMAPLCSERKQLETQVQAFCEARKDEFSKRRTRRLTYGEIGYRLVRSVSIPRAKDKVASLLKSLRAYGLGDECIQVEEKPKRDAIESLDDSTIAKLGLKRTVKDSFRVVPDMDAVEGFKEVA
ncbi:host-nuclease inhibitor Gam family protein [Desulfohalovibrio reitneri]|uniref:host-nuclease inhibitor Gam family protein n=1 Tax=Desulfohalovibrio reitneri TaxID=1307759 RepID=UPI000690AACF|nr:host-nuclease inhibitor Gam family protein [Desulfohalovibrio reitneri]